MHGAWVSTVAGMLLCAVAEAGSDPLVRISANANAVTAKEKDDSLDNLLDRTEFFVCNSLVDGMDGRYVVYEDKEFGSDRGTPVFAREDEDDELPGRAVYSTGQAMLESDFRLFRRNGFWMFADVAPWPPSTLFRCDPTKSHVLGVDFAAVCGMKLATPPLFGYSSVDAAHPVTHLRLQTGECGAEDDGDADLRRVVVVQSNLSGREDEL